MFAFQAADAFDLRGLSAADRRAGGDRSGASLLLDSLTDGAETEDPLAGIDDLLDLA